MMNLDRFGELEAAMHPSTPTGASSQDLTRVNCGSMVSLAPRTLHLAPCTLHLAPRTSHLACLAARNPLAIGLALSSLARGRTCTSSACLTACNPLAIGLALSSFGSRAHLHLFCLPHGSQPPLAIGLALSSLGSGRLPHGSHPSRHRTCSLVPWLEGAPAPLLLASRLATLSSPDLRPHLFPPFPTVTRRHGDGFRKVREWGNRDRETIP